MDNLVEQNGGAYGVANASAHVGVYAAGAAGGLAAASSYGITQVGVVGLSHVPAVASAEFGAFYASLFAGGTAAATSNCFRAGTPVSTPFGLRPIESIDVGDEVWSYNLASEQWQRKIVLNTHSHLSEGDFVTVRVDAEEIESTPAWQPHPNQHHQPSKRRPTPTITDNALTKIP